MLMGKIIAIFALSVAVISVPIADDGVIFPSVNVKPTFITSIVSDIVGFIITADRASFGPCKIWKPLCT